MTLTTVQYGTGTQEVLRAVMQAGGGEQGLLPGRHDSTYPR